MLTWISSRIERDSAGYRFRYAADRQIFKGVAFLAFLGTFLVQFAQLNAIFIERAVAHYDRLEFPHFFWAWKALQSSIIPILASTFCINFIAKSPDTKPSPQFSIVIFFILCVSYAFTYLVLMASAKNAVTPQTVGSFIFEIVLVALVLIFFVFIVRQIIVWLARRSTFLEGTFAFLALLVSIWAWSFATNEYFVLEKSSVESEIKAVEKRLARTEFFTPFLQENAITTTRYLQILKINKETRIEQIARTLNPAGAFEETQNKITQNDLLFFYADQSLKTILLDFLEIFELDSRPALSSTLRYVGLKQFIADNPGLELNSKNIYFASFVFLFRLLVAIIIFPSLLPFLYRLLTRRRSNRPLRLEVQDLEIQDDDNSPPKPSGF